jgi:RpiR family carbohydrate utilization transcriptional regulator
MNIDNTAQNMISHLCLVKFQSVYTNLKSAERKAADYCLKHPDKVATATITEVAEQAGCSEATFVRLAHRLGYTGYPELRTSILKDESESITHYAGISLDDDVPTIARNIYNSSIQALKDSFEIMDFDLLEKSSAALNNARRIQFAGAGDASVVAHAGMQKFLRLGFAAYYYSDYDSQLITLSQMSSGDVLVCISHSGRTLNICELAKAARERDITVIAITNFPVSPLTKNADIVLLTAAFDRDVTGEVITKRIPALCTLEALYVSVLIRIDAQRRQMLISADKLLKKNKL